MKKFLELKVYHNKRTGQASVLLPKKVIGKKMPKKVKIWRP